MYIHRTLRLIDVSNCFLNRKICTEENPWVNGTLNYVSKDYFAIQFS